MHAYKQNLMIGALLLVLGGAAGWSLARHFGIPDSGGAAVGSTAMATSAAPIPASAPATERKVLYWYDPMQPAQKFDKPGKSPFMDMELLPKYADPVAVDRADAPALTLSTQNQQSLGLRLATAQTRDVGRRVEAVGSVQLSERDVTIVQARTDGYVDRAYPHAPGDVIAAGTPLVDVFNPDWSAAQQEYLAVKATNDAALIRAARQRLVLLGMPSGSIERLDHSGQVSAVETIAAPGGGVLTELAVRRGMRVAAGTTLARINGLGTVWLEVAVPESEASSVSPGQSVQASFPALPGETFNGKVTAVLPEGNRDTRTLRVRVELPNPGQRLRAGLFAQVSLQSGSRKALTVPAEAVIRTGKRSLVYVADGNGHFRPSAVEIGEQFGDLLVIHSGIAEGQQVVASGQFLLDSEASLQGVLTRLAPPASGAQP